MSRSNRDQRGGHPRRGPRARSGSYSCQCCEVRPPREKSLNRTQRERAAWENERRAEELDAFRRAQREERP